MAKFGFTPIVGLQTNSLDAVEEEYRSDEDENYDDITKRLTFGGSEMDTPAPKSKKDTVQVFLRVRPRNNLEIQLKQAECFHFNNGEQELLAIPPRSSQIYKSKTSNLNKSKYTFTKIFGSEATQSDLFEDALLPSMKDFLDGQNCLVFTYGVTNSGKTYTVSGTPTNPGLLPRLLDVVFNSVQDGQLLTDVKFRPKHYGEVSYPTENELASQRALKEALLTKAVEVDHTPAITLPILDETDVTSEHDISCVSTISKASSSNVSKFSADDGMSFEHDSSSIELDDNGHYYSVWVSYAEIYNEFIYDLLGDPPVKGKLRPVLKLQEDRNHNQFIRGLREIQVNTVEEAMLLLKYGLRHRSQAATRLNYNSSRSHSVYTVKLVKVANPNKPSNALVNRVSVVDLAGAERSSKTGASGARVKEAGQINKSLLTLGKCIDAMKHNQQRKGEDHIVPFRESKLTRLFQNYFVGKGGREVRQGKVTMFVNISNTASVFDETLHVLKFSALTSKVMPLVKTLPGPTPRKPKSTALPPPTPSTLTRTHTRPALNRHSSDEEQEGNSSSGTDGGGCSNCKSLEEMMASLRCELRGQEIRIRQEVCREFNEQLIEIEESHSRELETQAEEIEELYEKRMKNLQKSMKRQYTRKRRRREDDEDEDVNTEERLRALVEELEDRNKELEEDLALERERAAAEVQDAAESHETTVVRLNKQLADKCVELMDKEKEVNELRGELTALREEVGRMKERENGEGALLTEVEALRQKLSTSETSTEYALAEVDILTSRISELTSEKEQVEAGKNEAEGKLKEALEQVSTAGCELCSSLQEQVASIESQLSSLTEEYSQEREQWVAERAAHHRDEEAWHRERDSLTRAQTQMTTSSSSQIEALDEVKTKLMAEIESLKNTHTTEIAAWEEKMEALTGVHSEEKAALQSDIEQLKGTQDQEKASLGAELESLQSTHTTEMAAWGEKMEVIMETHSKEKSTLQSEIEELQAALDKEKASLATKLETLKTSHGSEVELLQGAISSETASLKTELDSLREAHLREKTGWENQLEVVRNEVSSASAKVAVKNEQIYKLESEKEALEKDVTNLKHALENRLTEILELTDQKDSLSTDVKRTLREYETTLKNQTIRIQALERENEVAVSQSEELTQQCADLELRMSRACAAKEALSSRVEELTNSLEDSRKALSQRESELLDTSDQCRAMLEEQIADLKKTCATLEHQLTTAREDGKALQTTLNEKESELLSLAKSVGGNKAEVESVTGQLQELTKRHQQQQEENEKLLNELRGNHQLEVAQYTIRVRELGEELEAKRAELDNMGQSYEIEVETMKSGWTDEVQGLNKQLQQVEKKVNKLAVVEAEVKTLKKLTQQLKKEVETKKKEVAILQDSVSSLEDSVRGKDQELLRLKISQETAIQAVKEDCRREVEAARREQKDPTYEELPEAPTEEVVYDSVYDSTVTNHEAPPTNLMTTPTAVLKPVENSAKSRRSYLAAVTSSTVSERESLLDSSRPMLPILETSSQLEDDTIVADPDRKVIDATPRPLRKRKRNILSRKRSIEKENTNPPATKKSKYGLRSRSKKLKEEADQDTVSLGSLDEFTPLSQNYFKKLMTTTKKKASTLSVTSQKVEPQDPIATRTRKKRFTKSQLSAPTECFNSPANCRQALRMSGKGIQLGSKLRPVRPTSTQDHDQII